MTNIIDTPDWPEYVKIMSHYGRGPAELEESDVRPQDIKKVILNHRKNERVKALFFQRVKDFEDTHGFCPLTGDRIN